MRAAIGIRLLLCAVLGLSFLPVQVAAAPPDLSAAAFHSAERQLGRMRGNYFVPVSLVSEQLSMGLGIPNPIRRSSDGINVISGCRIHSCDEIAGGGLGNLGRAGAAAALVANGGNDTIKQMCP